MEAKAQDGSDVRCTQSIQTPIRTVKQLGDEHQEQVSIFAWARYASVRWPELDLLHAIPNGGHRHKAVAAKLRAEGVRRGVPDMFLPVPRRGWNGLYIELKGQRGKVSPDQSWWLKRLSDQGYRAVVCRGGASAQAVIEEYLSDVAHPIRAISV